MELPAIGNLFEGVLFNEEGHWKIQKDDGTEIDLDQALKNYEGSEVRFTVVKIEDLEMLAQMLEQGD